MKYRLSILFGIIITFYSCSTDEKYKDTSLSDRDRAIDLTSQLTLEEKVLLMGGFDGASSNAIPRLGIPSISFINGPIGVGTEIGTAFPAGVAFAATWNEELIHEVGVAMGNESRAKNVGILLGPCVNIHRHPIGGRNFESYSEDPFLSGRMGVNIVKGVQSKRVPTSVKHYALNNQELERGSYSAELDERTLREIYLAPFEMIVKEAQPMTLMAAYNKMRGEHCTENEHLLTTILRDEWGFEGFVMSDWDAVHSTAKAVKSGLDFEMPGKPKYLNSEKLIKAVEDGDLTEEEIDERVINVLAVFFKSGVLDDPETLPKGELDTPKHRKLAKKVAEEAIVLLKNTSLPGQSDILPLNKTEIKSIAVIGPSGDPTVIGGGGSSEVVPSYSVSPLQGLKKKLGEDVKIEYINAVDLSLEDWDAIESEYLIPPGGKEGEHGLKAEYFNNEYFTGEPALTRVDKNIDFDWGQGSPGENVIVDRFSSRWTGYLIAPKTGNIKLGLTTNDGSRLWIDDELFINNWGTRGPKLNGKKIYVEKGRKYKIRIEHVEAGNNASAEFSWQLDIPKQKFDKEAIALAKKSDVAIVFAGLSPEIEREAYDRDNMDLPGAQDDLINAVAAANKNTIVVMTSGSPVTMTDWINNVPGVIQSWYLGQETGNAIADVLFGDVNPSGKLPTTFPEALEDSPGYKYYSKTPDVAEHGEGVYVGYRYFDTKDVEPLFPFGHGLSYTTFEYSDLKIKEQGEEVIVTLSVTNTGQVKGSEIVQLYVHDVEAKIDRPVKELKGFVKVELESGVTQSIVIALDKRAFSFYDVEADDWVAEPGEFEIMVGASSRDIRLKERYNLK
ncbi:MAG: glycoside hydrolase family 3 C-terminal domain-containing protein [Bacteroidota bacterium]